MPRSRHWPDLILGRYRPTGERGRGGESQVLEATDLDGSSVALKLFTGERPEADAHAEFVALAELAHPAIVPVRARGYDDALGQWVLVLPLIPGDPLDRAWPHLSGEQRAAATLQIARGLGSLHDRGWVHGDVKPDNILVTREGVGVQALLIDFGMATFAGAGRFRGGTPAYFAPELRSGSHPTPRSDIFALGRTLERCARTALAGDPSRNAPDWLTRILPRALAPRPGQRFEHGRAFAEFLARMLAQPDALVIPGQLPFVGRERAARRAKEWMRDALRGSQGCIAVVSGPAGSGRARLARESLRQAPAAVTVLEFGRAPSVDEARRALSALAPRPRSAEAPPDIDPKTAEEVAAAIFQDLEGGSLALTTAAREDDPVDWQRFIASLVQHERAARAVGEPPRLAILLGGAPAWVERLEPDLTIPTRPLRPDDLVALLDLLAGGVPEDLFVASLARQLFEVTGGNPAQVDRTLRAAARTGRLVRGPLGLDLRGPWPDLEPASESIDGALAALAAGPRDLLDRLAIFGRPTPLSRLASLGAAPEELSALLASGLLVHVEHPRFEPTLTLARSIQEQIIARSTVERVASLHREWAALCFGSEAIFHRVAAGETLDPAAVDAAVASALASGDLDIAMRILSVAPDGPKSALHRGLCLLARGEGDAADHAFGQAACDGDPSVAGEAQLRLAESALARGDRDLAASRSRVVWDREHGQGDRGAKAQALLGFLALEAGRLDDAAAASTRGNAAAITSLGRAPVANLEGLIALRRGDWVQAETSFEDARDRLLAGAQPIAAAVVTVHLASVLARRGSSGRAQALTLESADTFRRAGHARSEAQARLNLGVLQASSGDFEASRASHRLARRLALATGHIPFAALALANGAFTDLDSGRPYAAWKVLQTVPREALDHRARILVDARSARAALELGRPRRARFLAARALAAARRGDSPRELAEARFAAALTAGSGPRRARLDQAVAAADRAGTAVLSALARAHLAGASASDPERAREWTRSAGALLVRGDCEPARPLVAEAIDDWLPEEEQRGAVAGALRWCARRGHPLGTYRLSVRSASSGLRRGRFFRSARAVRRALDVLVSEQHGMSPRAQRHFEAACNGTPLRELAQAAEARLWALARPAGRASSELAELLRILGLLTTMPSFRRLAPAVVDSALQLVPARAGFLVTRGPDGSLRFFAARTREGTSFRAPRDKVSRSIIEEVAQTGRSLIIRDAGADPRFASIPSVARERLRSLAVLPLTGASGGVLYLDASGEADAFSEANLPLLEAYAGMAGLLLASRQRESKRSRRSRRSQRALAADSVRMRSTRMDEPLIGTSAAMQGVRRSIDAAAATRWPVLILGESGTGKELVARSIHQRSGVEPFVAQNCAAIPEALIESELFGHVRGAFTGATAEHPGLLRLVGHGTLLLDEIGDLPLEAQARLLRALEGHEFRSLGGRSAHRFQGRLLAATHVDLRRLVAAGRFREDLYFRIAGFTIDVPPLRQRVEDIPELVAHVLARHGRELRVSVDAAKALRHYAWPGNVRQLALELARAALLCEGGVITAQDLSPDLRLGTRTPVALNDADGRPRPLAALERDAIANALAFAGQNRDQAAKLLGIARSTLFARLAQRDPEPS